MKRIGEKFDFYVMFFFCFLAESALLRLMMFFVAARNPCQP